tara:strand:- start:2184 stop:2384 length:201 start_codon:yes stop_codon:yes gene_type:complete
MGRVKAWAMEQQEDIQAQFIEGKINSKDCTILLESTGMDIEEIEIFIDENMAENAKAMAYNVLARQ